MEHRIINRREFLKLGAVGAATAVRGGRLRHTRSALPVSNGRTATKPPRRPQRLRRPPLRPQRPRKLLQRQRQPPAKSRQTGNLLLVDLGRRGRSAEWPVQGHE